MPTDKLKKEADPEFESDDFYDGFEGEDDLFDRSAGRAGSKSVAGAGAPEKVTYANLPRSVKVGVVIALVVGVLAGIYVASTPSSTDPFAGMEMPEGHPDISQMGTEDQSLVPSGSEDSSSLLELAALVDREPENVGARLDLGVAYFNSRNIEKAAEQWQTVLELDPDNVAALYNMGFYYMSKDPSDPSAAQEAWERVVQLDPESAEAVNVQSHLLELADEMGAEGVTGNSDEED